mgnify:CR=1 FL=1
MSIKKYIPNVITLINVFCGCMAILSLFNGMWGWVPVFVALGVAADFGDGMVARALGVYSELGKELDSLADMVTFGFLPGAVLYHLMATTHTGEQEYGGIVWVAVPGFLITLFSALRLAKFNIDERQSDGFIGLATPADTGFFMGLFLIVHFETFIPADWVLNLPVLYILAVVFSYLLVAEIPMFSLKFKSKGWRGNELPYIFLIASVVMLVTLQLAAFALSILTYLILVGVDNIFLKKSK